MSPPPGKARHRIYIVDDDEIVRDSLAFALRANGYAVSLFPEPRHLLQERFDEPGCLVIQCELRESSGLELLAELRRHGVTLPALLLTTLLSADICGHALNLGSPIVEKPLTTGALLSWLRALIDHHRARPRDPGFTQVQDLVAGKTCRGREN